MDSELIMPGAVEVDLGEYRLIPGPKGDTGDRGPRGYGIESAVLNPDFTLTLNFEDGSSYTTPAIRGADGVGVKEVRLDPGEYGPGSYTDEIVVELTDGKIFKFEIFNRAAEFYDKAEAAKTGAETAKAGAETARDAAEGAAARAAESETAAEKSAQSAEKERKAAEKAAENAVSEAETRLSGYVSDASSAAQRASDSAKAAQTAKEGAESAQGAAAGSAEAASEAESGAREHMEAAQRAAESAAGSEKTIVDLAVEAKSVEATEDAGVVKSMEDGHYKLTFSIPRGYGISDAKLNEDYTLALSFDDGRQVVLGPIRGEAGQTPRIGENGDWFLGETDTGVAATQLVDENTGRRVRMWFGTVSQYNALDAVDPDVYYNILEGEP